MVIITGVGRCGTSLLARFCNELGLMDSFGIWYNSVNAGGESAEAISINQRLIKAKLNNIFVLSSQIRRDVNNIKGKVIKDPRFLIDPDIINKWYLVNSNIKVIYLYRDFEKIVESSKKAPMLNSPNYRNHVDLIEQHHNKFLKNIEKIPHKVFKFPDYIDNPNEVYKTISEFTGTYNRNWIQIWNRIVDKNKVHE